MNQGEDWMRNVHCLPTPVAPFRGGVIVKDNRYFAKDCPNDFERRRLSLLTQMMDQITFSRLRKLGVGPGWSCLEVGAGDGSVARLLAKRVGPLGEVVATDLNTRFLEEHRQPNLEVRTHNILEDELETGHYDLVHCRCVLMHLSEPLRALRRMASALRPGGWLLIEEPDHSSYGSADPKHHRAADFDRRTRALWTALQAAGPFNPTFGRCLPTLLDGLGFEELGYDGVTLHGRGGDHCGRFAQMSAELLRARMVHSGTLTATDFHELHQAFADPSFWFIGFTVFGAWGRQPD
jgi:SAM-dependent methyltransferase